MFSSRDLRHYANPYLPTFSPHFDNYFFMDTHNLIDLPSFLALLLIILTIQQWEEKWTYLQSYLGRKYIVWRSFDLKENGTRPYARYGTWSTGKGNIIYEYIFELSYDSKSKVLLKVLPAHYVLLFVVNATNERIFKSFGWTKHPRTQLQRTQPKRPIYTKRDLERNFCYNYL